MLNALSIDLVVSKQSPDVRKYLILKKPEMAYFINCEFEGKSQVKNAVENFSRLSVD